MKTDAPQPPLYQWPTSDLQDVENELQVEYANISTTIIAMVVSLAKTVVPPAEGKIRLLEIARKNLRR